MTRQRHAGREVGSQSHGSHADSRATECRRSNPGRHLSGAFGAFEASLLSGDSWVREALSSPTRPLGHPHRCPGGSLRRARASRGSAARHASRTRQPEMTRILESTNTRSLSRPWRGEACKGSPCAGRGPGRGDGRFDRPRLEEKRGFDAVRCGDAAGAHPEEVEKRVRRSIGEPAARRAFCRGRRVGTRRCSAEVRPAL
jgi:hypothetical protein